MMLTVPLPCVASRSVTTTFEPVTVVPLRVPNDCCIRLWRKASNDHCCLTVSCTRLRGTNCAYVPVAETITLALIPATRADLMGAHETLLALREIVHVRASMRVGRAPACAASGTLTGAEIRSTSWLASARNRQLTAAIMASPNRLPGLNLRLPPKNSPQSYVRRCVVTSVDAVSCRRTKTSSSVPPPSRRALLTDKALSPGNSNSVVVPKNNRALLLSDERRAAAEQSV